MNIATSGISTVPSLSNSSRLQRLIPEPKSGNGLTFGGVLKTIGSLAGTGAAAATGAATASNMSDYMALIQEQNKLQKEMMQVTFLSNASKTRHETAMSAVRNLRVG